MVFTAHCQYLGQCPVSRSSEHKGFSCSFILSVPPCADGCGVTSRVTPWPTVSPTHFRDPSAGWWMVVPCCTRVSARMKPLCSATAVKNVCCVRFGFLWHLTAPRLRLCGWSPSFGAVDPPRQTAFPVVSSGLWINKALHYLRYFPIKP